MSCTTILVGRKASNDGSTMIARTEDGHFDVKKLIVVNPKDQPKKYKTKISHLEIELTEKPMRYTACSTDLLRSESSRSCRIVLCLRGITICVREKSLS